MKDPNEILRQKEEELARVRHEIQSLEIAASLLSDDLTATSAKKESSPAKPADQDIAPQATGTDGLFSSVVRRSSLWTKLKRGK